MIKFEYRGFIIVIIENPMVKGNYQGYVGISLIDPIFTSRNETPNEVISDIYDNYYILVHGGLTYQGEFIPESGYYFVGWDSAHHNDYDTSYEYYDDPTKSPFVSKGLWPEERAFEETIELAKQIDKLYRPRHMLRV